MPTMRCCHQVTGLQIDVDWNNSRYKTTQGMTHKGITGEMPALLRIPWKLETETGEKHEATRSFRELQIDSPV